MAKLAFEEERALKTAKMSKLRADEVKRLREENQARRHKQLVLRQSVMSNLADNAGQVCAVVFLRLRGCGVRGVVGCERAPCLRSDVEVLSSACSVSCCARTPHAARSCSAVDA